MKKVGIIGAGQLGFYLGLAAHKMGFEPYFLDSNINSPARYITNNFICADFDNEEKVLELVNECDVLTYEFENVDLEVIKKFSETKKIPQGHKPLEISNDRLVEKNTAKELDILTPKFYPVNCYDELLEGVQVVGFPCILKTRRFGYDGKGQYYLNNIDDAKDIVFDTKFILEEVIAFDYEISVIGVRSINCETVLYEPFLNVHKNGILHMTYTKHGVSDVLVSYAKEICLKFLVGKNLYGILCCELFVKGDKVYFNELAPRPHNSGHITMDSHKTSQYENHLRAILGLPLGSVEILKNGCMVNILGENYECIDNFFDKDTYIYDYKKGEAKEKRKMGHISYLGDDILGFEKKVKELLR
ncbi:MAG: 5-(carboxyamino)imidazole ribonucleotide synthase [Lachnospirales bacterium]